MSSVTNKQPKPPFRVDLDSEITTWPGSSLQSLSAIFVHLEKMAVRQNREAGSVWENENVAKLQELLSGSQLMEPGQRGRPELPRSGPPDHRDRQSPGRGLAKPRP